MISQGQIHNVFLKTFVFIQIELADVKKSVMPSGWGADPQGHVRLCFFLPRMFTLKALKYFFYKPWRSDHLKCLSWLFPLHLNTYVMCPRPL